MPLINISGSTSDTIAEPRIDSLIARDSEVTAAVNAHTTAVDPHTQYLLKRLANFLPIPQHDHFLYDSLDFNQTKNFPSLIWIRGGVSVSNGPTGLFARGFLISLPLGTFTGSPINDSRFSFQVFFEYNPPYRIFRRKLEHDIWSSWAS